MPSLYRAMSRDAQFIPTPIPTGGLVTATILSMLTMAVLAVCFTRRFQTTTNWAKIPLTRWLILAIYTDSILFIFATAVLEHGFGLNSDTGVCGAAILLCLACYLSTKLLIYYFLVEKVYVIRHVSRPRLKSKLYVFNCFMLFMYSVIVALNFVYRTAYLNEKGVCIIGMEKKSVLPLIIFDAVVNFYLTLLFVIPLRKLYSYKHSPNSTLRTVALRSFVGSLATLASSLVNLTILMVLKGEAAWICLMCCNADILFSVLVLHWVTSKDSSTTSSSNHSNLSNVAGSRANDKLGGFGQGGSKNVGTVTTVTAQDMNRTSEEEDDDADSLGKGRVHNSSYPLGHIKVGRDIQIESGPRSVVGSEFSTVSDTEARRLGSGRSTEDLVEHQTKYQQQ